LRNLVHLIAAGLRVPDHTGALKIPEVQRIPTTRSGQYPDRQVLPINIRDLEKGAQFF
jgi:hypothetical protein